ncbi:MAG: hypothetical protein ACM3O4_05575 [Ignavibacteriales bacterium]
MKLKNVLFTVISFFTIGITQVNAAVEPPLHVYNLIWNIESIYYYVDPSAEKYASPISQAAYNWVYTGYGWNNLYPNARTYYIIDSAIDIYSYSYPDGNNGGTNFIARTNVWSGDPYPVDPDIQNWLFGEIYLNDYYLLSKSSTQQQATIAHEMGHVFGLDENNLNQYSIMCQAGAGRQVYTVQQVDNNAFNRKHP